MFEKKKGNKSDLTTYFDILGNVDEKVKQCLPMYSDEELEELKGSEILTQVKWRKNRMSADYKALSEGIEEFKEFSEKEFCTWAVFLATRIIGVVMDG